MAAPYPVGVLVALSPILPVLGGAGKSTSFLAGAKQGRGLVDAFLLFVLRITVGDDAGA
jgi:hypothetical protein